MADRSRRISDPHMDIETKLLQIKFEEIYLWERLKKNEKEFNKWSKKLLKSTNKMRYNA